MSKYFENKQYIHEINRRLTVELLDKRIKYDAVEKIVDIANNAMLEIAEWKDKQTKDWLEQLSTQTEVDNIKEEINKKLEEY